MANKKTIDEPVRILQFIGSLDSGGSQSMILNLYKNIDRKKVQFDFVVDRMDELFYKTEIESLGGRVYVFSEYFKGFNYFKYINQWKKFFKQHQEYKIIHCHVRSVASIVLKIAKKYGLKTICHSHNTSNGRGFKSIIKKIFQGQIYKYCDYFFACSRGSARWLYGADIAESNRCIVLNNAIEVEKYSFKQLYRNEIRKRHSIQNETYLVGHVGRFEGQKNHPFIIELIEEMNNEKDLVFMLCGDGSLKESFKKSIKDRKLDDKVIIVASTKDVNKYYSAFDCFILPSLYEGLPMALVEAQFSGLMCLVSPNVSEGARMSDNYMIKELSIKEWKNVISKRIINKNRKEARLSKVAEKYDVRQTSRKLQQFYLDLTKEEMD